MRVFFAQSIRDVPFYFLLGQFVSVTSRLLDAFWDREDTCGLRITSTSAQ